LGSAARAAIAPASTSTVDRQTVDRVLIGPF
jgi:hypothetical protein